MQPKQNMLKKLEGRHKATRNMPACNVKTKMVYGYELKAQKKCCFVQCEGSWYCVAIDELVQ